MVNKDVLICGVRKQKNMLENLIEDLEPKSRLEENDLEYCEEVLKRVEGILRDLKRVKYDHGKYQGSSLYSLLTRI